MTYDIRRALVYSALEGRFGYNTPRIIMGYYDEPEVRKSLWTHWQGDDNYVEYTARRTRLVEWSAVMLGLGSNFTHSVSSLIMAYHSEKPQECSANMRALFNMSRLYVPSMTTSSNVCNLADVMQQNGICEKVLQSEKHFCTPNASTKVRTPP
jgi:hypothetical protein